MENSMIAGSISDNKDNLLNDLLIEIGHEEIPAGFLPDALRAFKEIMEDELKRARLSFKDIISLGTPRRTALYVKAIAHRQEDIIEEITGPPRTVAFNEAGEPQKAILGFVKKNNASIEDVFIKETPRGEYCCIKKTVHGSDATDVLPQIIRNAVADIPFKKTMKWEDSGFRFARPIRWLVALLGDEVIDVSIAGIKAGAHTYGHRFHADGSPIPLRANLDHYVSVLKDAHVIVSSDERRKIIKDGTARLSQKIGASCLKDDELIEINTFLTEYPYAVLGDFSPDFLELPDEVLITVMREHQKYFSVIDENGALLPHFIAINNIKPFSDETLKKGHERVLRARLNDAKFFFTEDTKRPLHEYIDGLKGVVFHKDLGSLYDKTLRIKDIALKIAAMLEPSLEDETISNIERAAQLSKADLITEMVGEFPDLQGIMGGIYAVKSGEASSVATAIKEHYLPRRSGDELPRTIEGAILSIADRLDTIVATFSLGHRPSGGHDPFGLRRHAIAIIHIMEDKGLSISLDKVISIAIDTLRENTSLSFDKDGLLAEIIAFFKARLKSELVSIHLIRPDSVEASLSTGSLIPSDVRMRAKCIDDVRALPEFEPLSIAFKRCMNILKKEGYLLTSASSAPLDSLMKEDAEKSLYNALNSCKKDIMPLLETGNRDYERAMLRLLKLKPYVDDFFDNVLVMEKDDAIRDNRLAILKEIVSLFLTIGDLSKISSQ